MIWYFPRGEAGKIIRTWGRKTESRWAETEEMVREDRVPYQAATHR